MPTAQINDVSLYYETEGEGPPLLLIAGLASDSQSWAPVRALLARRFTLIMPDNRGCGRTTPQEAPITLKQMADDAAALLTHLNAPQAAVLGHSMGGMIAATMAAHHPDRVGKLIMAASSAGAPAKTRLLMQDLARLRQAGVAKEVFFRLMYQFLFAPGFFEDEAAVDAAAALSANYPYPQSDAAFAAQSQAAAGFDPSVLAQIKAPTLLICGALDLMFSPDYAARTLAAIPKLSVHTLQGAAHSLHWDQPEAFCACVVQALAPQPS